MGKIQPLDLSKYDGKPIKHVLDLALMDIQDKVNEVVKQTNANTAYVEGVQKGTRDILKQAGGAAITDNALGRLHKYTA